MIKSKESNTKKTYNYVNEELYRRNIKLLSNDYKNNKMLLDLACLVEGCGKTWKATLNNITSKNSMCPRCSNQEHLTNEVVDELLDKYLIPVKRLDNISNTHKSYNWLCLKCGYIKKTNFVRVRKYHNKEFGCVGCRGIAQRVTVEEFDENIINSKREIIRIGEFVKLKDKVKMKCLRCDTVWNPKGAEIHNTNSACPNCCKGKGERFTGDILKRLHPNLVNDQYKFKANDRLYFIDYELELNGKQFFIEYNGEQHYKPVKFWGHISEFEKQQQRDHEVEEYCKINNIDLIIIRFDVPLGDIEKILTDRIIS